MKIEKPKKLSAEERAHRARERIWQGDAPGAKYFAPGEHVPRSAWDHPRGDDSRAR